MCRISAHNKMSELLNRNTDPLFEKMEKNYEFNGITDKDFQRT